MRDGKYDPGLTPEQVLHNELADLIEQGEGPPLVSLWVQNSAFTGYLTNVQDGWAYLSKKNSGKSTMIRLAHVSVYEKE